MAPSVLLLTGTVASGKTTIAEAIGELLAPANAFVCVDLDHLGSGYLRGASNDRIVTLRTDNLAAIWPNLRSAGFAYVIIAGAISTGEELRRIRDAIGDPTTDVVRLVSPSGLREARLRLRDSGRLLEDHLEVMATLEETMDRADLEDYLVANDGRPPREIAIDVMRVIGWP